MSKSHHHPGDAGERPNHSVDEAIVESVVSGTATPAQMQSLRDSLRRSDSAVDAYLDQIRIHALLEWRHGRVAMEAPKIPELSAREPDQRRLKDSNSLWMQLSARTWAAAAAVLIAASLAVWLAWRSTQAVVPLAAGSVVANVVETQSVVWADGQLPLAVGAEVTPGEIGIRSGTLRLKSHADAEVAIAGPARVRFVSASRLAAISGRVTTRVGPAGKGFIVETPGGEVVDLGTEFGVQVGSNGETAVVVFEGAVELKPRPIANASPTTIPASTPEPIPLTRGQAVRMHVGEPPTRIAAIERRPGSADWVLDSGPSREVDSVIASVRDNGRGPSDAKFYQIVHQGLAEDVRAYVDRSHEWNGVDGKGIPPELLGADLLMTFNDDKIAYDRELSLTVARPAAVYVFFKPRGPDVPDWLRRDFKDTGLTIGMDEGPPDLPNSTLAKGPGQSIDRIFHVWRRDLNAAGTITLGPNLPRNGSMYGVAAVAIPAKP